MRIVHVTPYIPPHLGGLEALVEALAARQVERGHEVTVVASNAGLDNGGAPPRREHRTIYVPAFNRFENGLGVPWPVFGPRLLTTLRRTLRGTDVLHVHGFLFMSTVAALAVARRAAPEAGTVLTEHAGHAPYGSRSLDSAQAAAIATVGRWSVRHADALVVYNRSARETVARVAPNRELSWIDNGIDFERFHPGSAAERESLRAELGWDGTARVLFAGRPVPKKGLDVALDAAAIGAGRFKLVVAGGGPERALEHVEWLGRVDPARMPSLYRAADGLIAPSRGEGPTLVMLEALASGLPMVVTDDEVIRERLGAAGAAVRLAPPDARIMAASLVELLEGPTEAASRAAVEFAHANFSVDAWIEGYERLYARLRAARGPTTET